MMTLAYYNEWDPHAAAWLRKLIEFGYIAKGIVDERSITEVTPGDLRGFTQCHFFAGIGGWSLSLRWAGIRDWERVWTGSPPCQPFSLSGKQKGQDDERHLAPAFLNLVKQCQPPKLFGEQVADAIKKHWLDDLSTELETAGYAVGASVLPACSIGAPHQRKRLFFGAVNLAHATGTRCDRSEAAAPENGGCEGLESVTELPLRAGGYGLCDLQQAARVGELGNANGEGLEIRGRGSDQQPLPAGREDAKRSGGLPGLSDILAHGDDKRHQPGEGEGSSCAGTGQGHDTGRGGKDGALDYTEFFRRYQRRHRDNAGDDGHEPSAAGSHDWPHSHNCEWSDADWLLCGDGKFRPVEPGTFPLADGISERVGLLRGYGNAIVPGVGAEFVIGFEGAIKDLKAAYQSGIV